MRCFINEYYWSKEWWFNFQSNVKTKQYMQWSRHNILLFMFYLLIIYQAFRSLKWRFLFLSCHWFYKNLHFFIPFYYDTKNQYESQVCLRLVILLPQLFKYWQYRHLPPTSCYSILKIRKFDLIKLEVV